MKRFKAWGKETVDILEQKGPFCRNEGGVSDELEGGIRNGGNESRLGSSSAKQGQGRSQRKNGHNASHKNRSR